MTWHEGLVVSAVASRQKGPGTRIALFVWSSSRTRMGFLRVLRFPSTVQRHEDWTGLSDYSELPAGVDSPVQPLPRSQLGSAPASP